MDYRDEIIETPPYGAPRSSEWVSVPPGPIPVSQPRRELRPKNHSTTRLVATKQYVLPGISDAVARPPHEARPTSLLPPPSTGTTPRTAEAGQLHPEVLPPPSIALPPAGNMFPIPPLSPTSAVPFSHGEIAALPTQRDFRSTTIQPKP